MLSFIKIISFLCCGGVVAAGGVVIKKHYDNKITPNNADTGQQITEGNNLTQKEDGLKQKVDPNLENDATLEVENDALSTKTNREIFEQIKKTEKAIADSRSSDSTTGLKTNLETLKTLKTDLITTQTNLKSLRVTYQESWKSLLNWSKTHTENVYLRHEGAVCDMKTHQFTIEQGKITVFATSPLVHPKIIIKSHDEGYHTLLSSAKSIEEAKDYSTNNKTYKGHKMYNGNRNIDFLTKSDDATSLSTLKSNMQAVFDASIAIQKQNTEIYTKLSQIASLSALAEQWNVLNY